MNPVIFTAPLAIAVIGAVLAALISITDKIVNNYGDLTIDINSGKRKLEIKGGSPLLSTLAESGIFVPSACGGKGSCGACKVKVLSDIGPHLPTEPPYLTKEEMAENVRLSCQIKVKQDLEIEIPDALFNIRRFTGVVERIKDLTHDIKEVYIKLENPAEINFTAGQYGQLEIPPYEKIKGSTQRAYSMSSPPSDKDHVEFLIRLVPGGIVTTYVHQYMKEGEKIAMVGPFGDFAEQDTQSPMICVAGGSGMAPFKSILYDMDEKGPFERDVWYFFGARTKKDLFYLEEMQALEAKQERFHFIPALSEPLDEDEWKGEIGLITDVLDKYLKEIVPDADPKEGYLCGSPGMIDACVNVMTANDIGEGDIFYDKFA
ncbi:MAG: 2Fe-2S iron-sulfur cluster binding domain-containing protein [Spirochaetales bacterium]|nr:2Fe-2S iron-sulfur cluster binding domain-containing protein [Spirochaetales bacterium]MCF7938724.1 2Fe-2S iron-sulfur cluster binding domain-containing protein [Spirochaetales bacterium]